MKSRFLAFLFITLCMAAQGQQGLNVMTFNIRWDNPGDSANAWPFRKDKVAGQILFHAADVVGVQEALHRQMLDLKTRLPKYAYVGVGRDDGKEKGEYSAIFYDSTRLRLQKSGTFWLAPNPETAGMKGWDAALPRIVTWAMFRYRNARNQFYVFNTHFDHMGKIARAESAKLLLRKVLEIGGTYPCIVMGDFNAAPDDEPIKIIGDVNDVNHLINAKAVSTSPHYGPSGTFNGFQAKETTDQPIDHIFIKNGVRVLQHATLSQTWGGRFSSDHFPVFARVLIP